MREIRYILCSCGGKPVDIATTKEEDKEHNCSRGCCLDAIQCPDCKTKFLVAYEAPEMY